MTKRDVVITLVGFAVTAGAALAQGGWTSNQLGYAAPEAATRQLLAEAMANPQFAQALLAKASPESLQRAMGYVEQTMGKRLTAAAMGAGARQGVRSLSGEANRQETPQGRHNPLFMPPTTTTFPSEIRRPN